MEVLKVFNNNVVLARERTAGTSLLTGRGLGFAARRGDAVDATKVSRSSTGRRARRHQLSVFLTEIPPEHLRAGGGDPGVAPRPAGHHLLRRA